MKAVKQSLRINFAWILCGNIMYTLSQWALLVSLARVGKVEWVGIFVLSMAICSPIIMFANLRLRFVQASDTNKTSKFDNYFVLRLVSTGFALLILFSISIFWQGDRNTSIIIGLVALAKSIEAISDIFYGYLQRQEVMYFIGLSMIIKGLLSVSMFISFLYFFDSLIMACTGLVIAWAVVLVFVDMKSVSYIDGVRDGKFRLNTVHLVKKVKQTNAVELWRLGKKSFPLGVVALLVSASLNIPKYFIGWFQGSEQLGYFASILYIMTAGVTVVSALGQSAMPRLAKLYDSEAIGEFLRLLYKLLAFSLLIGAAGMVLAKSYGGIILRFLYGPDFSSYSGLFFLIMLASALNYVALFMWYCLTAMGKFKTQLALFIGDVSLILAMSYYLIPILKLNGAAYAIIIIMTYHIIVCGCIIHRNLHKLKNVHR